MSPRLPGALFIAEAVLAFAPVAVLGPAFGWPASLRQTIGLRCAHALRAGALPRWLAALGLVTSLALASVATPSFWLALAVPVAVGSTLLSVWMLAAGIWLLRSR